MSAIELALAGLNFLFAGSLFFMMLINLLCFYWALIALFRTFLHRSRFNRSVRSEVDFLDHLFRNLTFNEWQSLYEVR